MRFKVSDWIDHNSYGTGQILGDDETYWVIRFVDHGEKKMGKKFIEHPGQPPYPGFEFPKVVTHKFARIGEKRTIKAIPDLDEIIEKFLLSYPDGLKDAKFNDEERIFKAKAVNKFADLLNEATLTRLIDEGSFEEVGRRSRQVMSATNLVFKTQIIQFSEALKSASNQEVFSLALSDVLYGKEPEEARFERYIIELGRIGTSNWPVATYFQFLERQGKSMFMKPTVAKRMADSVGIALNYKPEPNWLTYSKLQEVAQIIRARLLDAGQTLQSEVDVQSFMWCAYGIAKQ